MPPKTGWNGGDACELLLGWVGHRDRLGRGPQNRPEMGMPTTRPLALVTGASTGIGYQLAKCCGKGGFDLFIAADEAEIEQAAADCRSLGVEVEAVQADLGRPKGSTGCWPPPERTADRSMPYSPMSAAGSARLFWIRTSRWSGASWTPTSPARST
jgi:short chain dehydrogenase